MASRSKRILIGCAVGCGTMVVLVISSRTDVIHTPIDSKKTRRKPVRSAIQPQGRLMVLFASRKQGVRIARLWLVLPPMVLSA